MAQFNSVTWDEDDEIVSDKLQQMADNETFLRNSTFFPYGIGGTLFGGVGDIANIKIQIGSDVLVWEGPGPQPQGEATLTLPFPFPNGLITVLVSNGDRNAQPENIYSTWTGDNRLDAFNVHVFNTGGSDVVGHDGRVDWIAFGW